jgi:hypothetical protein
MSDLPLRVNNRTTSDLDDEIAWAESGGYSCQMQVDMGPMGPMIMDIVGHFAEEDPVLSQYTKGFTGEWRVQVLKIVLSAGVRFEDQPKPCGKVLDSISAIVRKMRWIIYDHIKELVAER